MKTHFCCLLTVVTLAFSIATQAQIITTIAGGGTSGLGDGGEATACELDAPYFITLDMKGNLYIADSWNNRIRKVSTTGIISTIAGNGMTGYNGDSIAATAAKLNDPSGVAVDASGNIYISDNGNHRIRIVDTSSIIRTFAGTGVYGYNGDDIAATAANIYSPHGIALDQAGNLYICDCLNNRIRKVSISGSISTIAGTGALGYDGDGGNATAAKINSPYGVALDASGNIYFTDEGSNGVRKINSSGVISTVAGGNSILGFSGDNGPATTADFHSTFGVAVDGPGNIYICDSYNDRVRKVNTAGIVTTYAGSDSAGYSGDGGPATLAKLHAPVGIAVDGTGNVYISDYVNCRIRLVKNVEAVYQINNQELVKIFPNPCHGDFEVQVNSVTEYPAKISVTDVTGKTITCLTAVPNRTTSISLNAAPGLYFVTVTTPHRTQTVKVIKECR